MKVFAPLLVIALVLTVTLGCSSTRAIEIDANRVDEYYGKLGLSINNQDGTTERSTSTRISWSIPTEDSGSFTLLLKDVLRDSRGWIRAGVNFEYQSNKPSTLNAAFEIYPLEKIGEICGGTNNSGCAGVKIVEEELQCTIYLAADYLSHGSAFFNDRFAAVNHEMGHCFGLIHSDISDVMFVGTNVSLYPEYPSDKEIAFLITLFESGKVFDTIAALHSIDISKLNNKAS